ncbi:uncharacterized protein LOC119459408 [Dermacentor silvarum]|uniref:uncharacterized protein LOC119459408 n=1 Tax=Dermacentor silvarum TaxID=543639 RepID=UPI0018994E54|nr:uncharacterized protein LOC119459408 [Dermacentor silvarum]
MRSSRKQAIIWKLRVALRLAACVFCPVALARKEEAPSCFDELINDDGVACFNRILRVHNLREHARFNATLSQEGRERVRDCFRTSYGNSTSHCLNGNLFTLLVLCWYDKTPEMREAFHSAGVNTRQKLVQIGGEYRDCLMEKPTYYESTAKEGTEERGHGFSINTFYGGYRSAEAW